MARTANLNGLFKKMAEINNEATKEVTDSVDDLKGKNPKAKDTAAAKEKDSDISKLDTLLTEIGDLEDMTGEVKDVEEAATKLETKEATIRAIMAGEFVDPEMEKIASDVTEITLNHLLSI